MKILRFHVSSMFAHSLGLAAWFLVTSCCNRTTQCLPPDPRCTHDDAPDAPADVPSAPDCTKEPLVTFANQVNQCLTSCSTAEADEQELCTGGCCRRFEEINADTATRNAARQCVPQCAR